ncbi:MAG: TIR domain-containing protein [Lachnospiraceae bacterium]|nr:TIR domain-containing protein [Lachnospiraceae bacterium]
MQEDKIPKIFISYSWSSLDLVLHLAERLTSHGVDVVWDKWCLKEGQDKYAFMERCVNDPEITKVLIVCDEKYTAKANNREGGVGDETVIISSEIYGRVKQDKFIPIIAERDDEGNPFVPAYIKSRIYIDLSAPETYEEEYEKLLRNIYEKPLYRKPKLGKRPEWLDEENKNFFPLTDLIRQIKGSQTSKKLHALISRFIEEYISTLKSYFLDSSTPQQVYENFVKMKMIRDVFLNFLTTIGETGEFAAEIMGDCFEKMHNTLTCAKGFDSNTRQAKSSDYEIYRIHIWELFICVIAYFRSLQDYESINCLLTRTYFLTASSLDDTVWATNYIAFRHYSKVIEECYKPTTDDKDKFTLLGNELCCKRDKVPFFSGEALAEADLFLYQVGNALKLTPEESSQRLADYWFPTCYLYVKQPLLEWKMMRSKRFCEKLYPLFGVDSIAALKDAVKDCVYDKDMRYNRSFDAAPSILCSIKLEEIGSVN